MHGDNATFAHDSADDPVFAATITPHRSLGPEGFRVLMTICCVVAGLGAVRAYTLGFWPVAGFLLLDVLALYVAFRINYRRGHSSEQVVLTPIELLLRRVTDRGVRTEWRLNPLWTRMQREEHEEFGVQRLVIVSGRQRIVIAGELSPGERATFADEFQRALAQVKRGC
jgi:uncharacterized membrane protein